MKLRTSHIALSVGFILGITLSLTGVFVSAMPVASLENAPRPTWTRSVPPTFTPTPSAPLSTPTARPPDSTREIWLRVELAPWCDGRSLWTVMQWQDGLGQWHDIPGWQGPLDIVTGDIGRKVWVFPATMSGSGPFRWRVCPRPPDGINQWCVVSDAFELPYGAREYINLQLLPAPVQ